jgi:predicted phage terminase large subunit-like protein
LVRKPDMTAIKKIAEFRQKGLTAAEMSPIVGKSKRQIQRIMMGDNFRAYIGSVKEDDAPLVMSSNSIADKALADLWYFATEILGYKDFTRFTHGVIFDILQEFETSGKNLLLLMPRDFFKTTLVVGCYIPWRLLRRRTLKVGLQLETYDKGLAWVDVVKSALENPKVVELFGKQSGTTWGRDRLRLNYVPKNITNLTMKGADQSLTGLHGELIIIDDPHGLTNTQTEDQIEKTCRVWSETVTNVASAGAQVIQVATIWNEKDTSVRLINREVGSLDTLIEKKYHQGRYWDIYWAAALEKDPNGTNFEITAKDSKGNVTSRFKEMVFEGYKLTFPERVSIEELCKKYETNTSGDWFFACQNFNDWRMSKNGVFTADMLEKAKQLAEALGTLEGKTPILDRYLLVDPAYSLNKKSDYSAFILCGFDRAGVLHIMEAFRDKLDAREVVDKIFALRQQYHPRLVGVEANASQQVLLHWIKERQLDLNIHFRIEGIKTGPKQSKQDRIKALLPYFKSNKIAIPEQFEELHTELACFPSIKHDDLSDALSFIEKVKKPMIGGYTGNLNINTYYPDFGYTPFWCKEK